MTTYRFICEVETLTYDFTKSLLIDAAMLKYKPSLTVAALISASLEIYFNLKYEERLDGIKKSNQENWSIN